MAQQQQQQQQQQQRNFEPSKLFLCNSANYSTGFQSITLSMIGGMYVLWLSFVFIYTKSKYSLKAVKFCEAARGSRSQRSAHVKAMRK